VPVLAFDRFGSVILYWAASERKRSLRGYGLPVPPYHHAEDLWMHRYSSLSDDFYVNMNLSTEMELPTGRDSILHFFERLQKQYPTMANFYCREKGDFILEEDKEQGQYRWCTLERRRLCSGHVNPPSVEQAVEQHHLVLELAPYLLSLSPIECEALDLLFGFDFTYRGNHNQLIAEALGINPALERALEMPHSTIVHCEPTLTLALDEDCRTQCRLSIETRTNLFQMRTGDFPEDQLSVYVTARRYGGLAPGATYAETLTSLTRICHDMVDQFVAESVLRPLARAISAR
jgi:hypothetical protein